MSTIETPPATKIVIVGLSVTETTVNTYKNEKVEVPNSQNAKAAFLLGYTMDTAQVQCGTSELGIITGSLLVGDLTARTGMALINTVGCVDKVENYMAKDASGIIVAISNRDPMTKKCPSPVPIPKTADGKFYLTAEVLATLATSARSLYCKAYVGLIL